MQEGEMWRRRKNDELIEVYKQITNRSTTVANRKPLSKLYILPTERIA